MHPEKRVKFNQELTLVGHTKPWEREKLSQDSTAVKHTKPEQLLARFRLVKRTKPKTRLLNYLTLLKVKSLSMMNLLNKHIRLEMPKQDQRETIRITRQDDQMNYLVLF